MVSVAGNLVVVVIFPFVVSTSSIVFPNFPMRYGCWWSMNGDLVGFSTGWNSKESQISCCSVTLMSIPNGNMLERRWVHCWCRLFTGGYLHAVNVHLQMFSLMVGGFAGWFMYFSALPNLVSIFQNSTGCSGTSSFMLHDLVFTLAWFSMCRWCPPHSISGVSILNPNVLVACS